MKTVLTTQSLTKRYGKRNVVDGVSLNVLQGDIYGFLGPNGAGKTTTLRMVTGLIKPSSGQVAILGEDPAHAARSLMAEIGSMIEGPAIYPHLSAAENLLVAQRLKGRGSQDEIADLLTVVGLPNVGELPAERFSLGMKQRLGIAMALVGKPKLLILDEPTNGLDPEGFLEMRQLFRRLVDEREVTILLSSHLLNEVEQVATRVGFIRDGKLLVEASVTELRKQWKRHLEITVSDPEAAGRVLQEELGVAVQQTTGRNTLVVHGEAEAAMVNRVLVNNQFDVSRLVEQDASLETVFFDLIGGGVNV